MNLLLSPQNLSVDHTCHTVFLRHPSFVPPCAADLLHVLAQASDVICSSPQVASVDVWEQLQVLISPTVLSIYQNSAVQVS